MGMQIPTCVVVCLALTAAGAHAQQDEARAVIEKAITAHGGEKQLAKLQAMRFKGHGTLEANNVVGRFTVDNVNRLPDRSKFTMVLEINDANIDVAQSFDGKKAWSKIGEQVEELDDERLAEQAARAYHWRVTSLVPLLKDKNFKLSPLGETKVKDRAAVGVRVEHKGHKDVNLFFDKLTGLLAKTERSGLNLNQKEVTRDTYYSAYKAIDGVQQALKILVHYDGQRFMEFEITEMTFPESIPDAEFTKP
ncbi:MAG: hypothetical protein L0Y72_32330 [Gemmataceae bacterium]|nr:hypothetical protein [Gemmataceae bacterium]MCI0743743.1 hypothetical protein [Gemmataceae bacterium]